MAIRLRNVLFAVTLAKQKRSAVPVGTADFLFVLQHGISAKQERNAPQAGQTNQGVYQTAEQGTLTAEEPCHQVESENSHQAPVQTANNGNDRCNGIHHISSLSEFAVCRIPKEKKNIIAKIKGSGYNYFQKDRKQ